MSTQLASVTPGYDIPSDFPSEPAGWGEPGTVRHAENIGHGVWMAEHPEKRSDMDPTPVDDLESWHDSYDPGGHVDELIEKHFGTEAMCPIHDCARTDHPMFEMCEDAVGHTWFQGDDQAEIALSEGPDLTGGIQP